jgi:hypothetical protein
MTRVLMTTGPDRRDITIGQDSAAALWVYSVSSGRACGRLDGPLCVLPSPLDDPGHGAAHYVLCGLTEQDDPTTMVIVDYASDSVSCRVHDHVWVSRPLPFEFNARPLVRWEHGNRTEVRQFRMAPLVADMLETGSLSYAPLP